MKFVIDDKIPFIRGVFEPYGEVVYKGGAAICHEDVADADALIVRTRTRCDAALLEESPVRCIATATIGFDHIDVPWCESKGIKWSNVPGCNSSSVAQYIASVLVTLARRKGLDLSTMTLGVVGVGHVGSKVAKVGEALGMKVLLCDPPRQRHERGVDFVDIDSITSQSDIITLHVPLTKEGKDATYHLFDSERIRAMKPGSILINSSRGQVVDNVALENALASLSANEATGISGAVLDVWEGEPQIRPGLLELVDIATPHIAGYSADGKANGTAGAVQFVAKCLGLPFENWRPDDSPVPSSLTRKMELCPYEDPATINLENENLNASDTAGLISEAILATYDVAKESETLKADPSCFEQYRGDYPTRREFPYFTAEIKTKDSRLYSALKSLGFNVK